MRGRSRIRRHPSKTLPHAGHVPGYLTGKASSSTAAVFIYSNQAPLTSRCGGCVEDCTCASCAAYQGRHTHPRGTAPKHRFLDAPVPCEVIYGMWNRPPLPATRDEADSSVGFCWANPARWGETRGKWVGMLMVKQTSLLRTRFRCDGWRVTDSRQGGVGWVFEMII